MPIDYFDGLLDDLNPNQFQSLLAYLIGKNVNCSNIIRWRRENNLQVDSIYEIKERA